MLNIENAQILTAPIQITLHDIEETFNDVNLGIKIYLILPASHLKFYNCPRVSSKPMTLKSNLKLPIWFQYCTDVIFI